MPSPLNQILAQEETKRKAAAEAARQRTNEWYIFKEIFLNQCIHISHQFWTRKLYPVVFTYQEIWFDVQDKWLVLKFDGLTFYFDSDMQVPLLSEVYGDVHMQEYNVSLEQLKILTARLNQLVTE